MILNWSMRKALVARMTALSSSTLMSSLVSRGDQRPSADRFLQHVPQPAAEVMYG